MEEITSITPGEGEESKVLDSNPKLSGKTHTKIVIPGPIKNGNIKFH